MTDGDIKTLKIHGYNEMRGVNNIIKFQMNSQIIIMLQFFKTKIVKHNN